MGFPITGRMNHEHAHRASSAGGIIDALKESVILDIKDGPGYVWAEHLISWAFVHFFLEEHRGVSVMLWDEEVFAPSNE